MFYEKELLYLEDRVKKSDVKNFSINPASIFELLSNVGMIASSKKMKPHLKTKIISLIKGQFYAKMEKTLKQKFIISSLGMYHGEEASEMWDYEHY